MDKATPRKWRAFYQKHTNPDPRESYFFFEIISGPDFKPSEVATCVNLIEDGVDETVSKKLILFDELVKAIENTALPLCDMVKFGAPSSRKFLLDLLQRAKAAK